MASLPHKNLWGLLLLLFFHSANASVEVTDDFDRIVTLDSPAKRIISLAPHNTENLYSAGLGKRIVGVDEFSRFPESAKLIKSVGSAVQLNIEAIITLNPDLIVVWQTASNKEKLETLIQLGYTLYYSEPRSFEGVIENIQDFAILGGTTSEITPNPHALRTEIEDIKKQFSKMKRLSVFYQIWTNPLITLNGDHFISRVLEICGAQNIFSRLSIIAPHVSIEAVVQGNPDIIITGEVAGVAEDMSLWQPWKSITAVANQNYLFVNSSIMHRHTARMIMGVRALCENIDDMRNKLQ